MQWNSSAPIYLSTLQAQNRKHQFQPAASTISPMGIATNKTPQTTTRSKAVPHTTPTTPLRRTSGNQASGALRIANTLIARGPTTIRPSHRAPAMTPSENPKTSYVHHVRTLLSQNAPQPNAIFVTTPEEQYQRIYARPFGKKK